MLKNYIFDLGGVLLDLCIQNVNKQFMELGLPSTELTEGGSIYKLAEDYQLGRVSTQDFCKLVVEKCMPGTTLNDIEQAWNSICVNIAERKLEALRRLRKTEGVASISLLSNTNELHWEYCCKNWFNAHGNKPEDFFDRIFLSQELHLQKPDPEIFKTAIRELGASPAETIFLDDSAVNTAAAASCGLQTLTVTPDVDWVRELGI